MHAFFVVLQIIFALGLIGIVMTQASKQEGLGGAITGKTESSFQGKPGMEEKLDEITKWAAVGFMVVSFLVAYIF